MYQLLEALHWRHVYLVGDLHGCLPMLALALRQHRFDPWQDLLIAVGDLIDRGPDSAGCLGLLQKPWFRSVRGNHEQMAIEALTAQGQLWQYNGGEWFYQLPQAQQCRVARELEACALLPLVIEFHTGSAVHVIAHADYPAAHYQRDQPLDQQEVLWSRSRLQAHLRGHGQAISGADAFWFGHTPLRQPQQFHNQHYIDTGAVFGNTLTLIKLC
ncbi:serine/threonine-protein phosphatase [Shimwellia pseudoproteus]|uniref:metallophosphoesterase n=1 Tax=Shimwellia pseudoproteus TaxID=570012 RepID=UPI0018EE25CE|nr:metallophosphoesterase [Shimwellia pseudoproteus]MBJ3813716.1 serine/threonine-protein phosphatase [Shimwellia pseudoproteus]